MPTTKPPKISPQDTHFTREEADKHLVTTAQQCRFIGHEYPTGTLICWEGNEFICVSGDWKKTGKTC